MWTMAEIVATEMRTIISDPEIKILQTTGGITADKLFSNYFLNYPWKTRYKDDIQQ